MQKYQILSVIGEGAYGVVLKCKSNETKEILAIKKFKESEDDELVRKVTMRQVKILKKMKNPNIVELRDAFRRKGIVYLVFEYVENNLLEILQKSPEGLQPQIIKNIIYQLIKGLAYMHSNHVIHRDIKPQNLLISENKELKICDFGFARSFKRQGQDYTDYVATRWYRPPELLVGAPYDSPIDIWAVGCIMAELIDGNPLFPGENEFDQLFLIQKCLGSLTPDHFQTFLKNPRFIGMKFPEITNLETIEKRYLGKLSQKALNFLKSTLKLNPAERITAIQALNHPYFESVRESDIVRKYSVSNNYNKGENKISNTSKEEFPNSVSYERKKIQNNMFNPSGLNLNLDRERQKTEQTHLTHDNMFNTKGTGKFYHQPPSSNQGNKTKGNKISRQEIKNFQLTSKGFNPIQSKSVNKTSHNVHNNLNPGTKISKLKDKYISLEKGHSYNRDHAIQTQAGFYKNKIMRMDFPDQDQVNMINSNKNRASNRVHSKNYAQGHLQVGNKSRNAKNRSIMNTEEIFEEEDQGTFSSAQLPFLMVASQHTQASVQKHSHSQNPSLGNNTGVSKERQQRREKEMGREKQKTFNQYSNYNQVPNNLNIIISNSTFNNYHHQQGQMSSSKNY